MEDFFSLQYQFDPTYPTTTSKTKRSPTNTALSWHGKPQPCQWTLFEGNIFQTKTRLDNLEDNFHIIHQENHWKVNPKMSPFKCKTPFLWDPCHHQIHLTKFPELLPVPLYLVARQRAPSRSNHFSHPKHSTHGLFNNIWLIFPYTCRSGIYKNGNLPKFWRWKVKIKHIWNHHLVNHVVQWFRLVVYFSLQKRDSTLKIASISETPTLNQNDS